MATRLVAAPNDGLRRQKTEVRLKPLTHVSLIPLKDGPSREDVPVRAHVPANPAFKPGVLLVIGAYYPELSGAGLQTRSIVRRLSDHIDFSVLTTTADRSL